MSDPWERAEQEKRRAQQLKKPEKDPWERAEEEKRRAQEPKKVKVKPRDSSYERAEREKRRATGSLTREEQVEADITRAEEAIKTAESYKQSVGSTITWGDKIYNLGTTQGWRDYQQAVRETKSGLSAYKRSLFEQRAEAIQGQAPRPQTAQIPYFQTEVGPPKQATASDMARLRAEGYDLPEGKTIYISPSGEVYYYEEEPKEPRKTLSMRLWEASKRFEESDTAKLFGVVPYSEKGARQIGAVVVSGAERTLTSLFGFVPGEQPLEIMPDEQSFSWRDLGFSDMPKGKLFAARATGTAVEFGLSFGTYAAAGWGVSSVIGASGALVSKLPYIGPGLEVSGAWVSSILSSGPAQVFFAAPIVALEWEKVKTMKAEGRPTWEIAAEIEIDMAKLFGTAYGFSRGLSYGKQLPTKMERLLKGGVTIPEEAIVPENVIEGEGRFPRFKSEPFEPTAEGYKQFAEKYTPEELRITGEGVPSYHVTTTPIKGDFVTKPGLRVGTLRYDEILGKFVGRGEYGYFVSPAASTRFARLGSEGYSLMPGFPNLFGGEAKILLGEYAGVEATTFSKSSAELADLLKAAEGSGKLFMPLEQMSEAQAVLSPGTMMVKVPGAYYTDIGGKTIKIDRFLPKILTDVLGVEGPSIPYSEYLSRQVAGASSLVGEQPTTYLPILSSKPSKTESTTIDKVSVSKPSKLSETSIKKDLSITSDISTTTPSIVSVTSVTGPSGTPSRGGPSIVTPSKVTPEPSRISDSKITGITSTPSRDTPSKTPPISKITSITGEPSKTTKLPILFDRKPQRSVQAVDVFKSRKYRYRTIEASDIIGTGKRSRAAPQINIFDDELPNNLFGKKKKSKSLKIF